MARRSTGSIGRRLKSAKAGNRVSFPDFCRRTFSVSGLRLAETDARSSSVLIDEIDTRRLEGPPYDVERSPAWLTCSAFKLMDGDSPNARPFR